MSEPLRTDNHDDALRLQAMREISATTGLDAQQTTQLGDDAEEYAEWLAPQEPPVAAPTNPERSDTEDPAESPSLVRIRAVKERVDQARAELDHAEVEVVQPDATGVDKRLAAVRALLRDGDRLLEGAVRSAAEDENLDLVSETAIDAESESTRERTVQRATRQRL